MDFAKSFEGADFINSLNPLDWAFSKSIIPERFTCASLAWWCASQVYGIDISNPVSPTVTPAAIILSPFVDIKGIIEAKAQ